MSTVRSHLDEFESVFRSAVRPHVEVQPLAFERLLVVVDAEGDEAKSAGVLTCAADLADRFRVECRLVAPVPRRRREQQPDTTHAEAELKAALEKVESVRPGQVSGEVLVGSPARVILEQVAASSPSLIIMPSLFGEADVELESFTLGSVADRVLATVREPILLIEGAVENPSALWTDMLVYVEDAETSVGCLSAAVKLAEKGARTTLLHVLDQGLLATMRHGIELASELESDKALAAIQRSLTTDMEHYLSGAAQALIRTGHKTEFAIEVGDPIETTRDHITSGGYKLLVCNSVAPDQKLIDSVAYNLAAYLREIPLLLV